MEDRLNPCNRLHLTQEDERFITHEDTTKYYRLSPDVILHRIIEDAKNRMYPPEYQTTGFDRQ